MAKLQILLCDTDEKYLMPLERKFIDGFEDSADIMIITDPEYLKVFFQSQRKIDILVINESLYVKDLEKHNIEFLFILMEQMTQDTTTTGLNSNQIYKYTSVKEIYNEIANCSAAINRKSKKQDENTKLIMVYSPIGGAGVTTLAIGLAGALAQNHRHVLYIGTDNLQSFGYRLADSTPLPSGVEKQIIGQGDHLYDVIKVYFRNEIFDYLPPFPRALSSLNVHVSDLSVLLERIAAAREYDFIVVDSVCDFSDSVSKMMASSDQIVIVLSQKPHEIYKARQLLKNVDFSDGNKFTFVCNRYDKALENHLISDAQIQNCKISEYFQRGDGYDTATVEELAGVDSFQKLAIQFI